MSRKYSAFLKKAEEEGNELYEVEKILDHKVVNVRKSELDFFVKFKGYFDDQNMWVPDTEMYAPELLKEYWDNKKSTRMPSKTKRGRKPKRGEAAREALKAKRAKLALEVAEKKRIADEARKNETPEEKFLNSRPHIRTLMERLEIEARESAEQADRELALERQRREEEGIDDEEEEELIRVIKIEPEEGGEGDYIVDAEGKHYKLL